MFKVINILYPERCPKCDNTLPLGKTGFCKECENDLHIIKEPVCVKCGRPVCKYQDICEKCSKERFHKYVSGRALFGYSDVNDILYRFKYMNRPEYARAFAKLVKGELSEWLDIINPDAFVPVPLHKKRLIKRGYNQAEELAKEITKFTGIPTESKLVYRVKKTLPLKQFDREDRALNLKNAFIVKESVVKLDTVVLVDDIFTTGSTVDAIAEVLHEAGVRKVYFLTVAIAGTQVLQLDDVEVDL